MALSFSDFKLAILALGYILLVILGQAPSYSQELSNKTSQALDFSRCQINHNAIEMDAECAIYTRPENPQELNGKVVDLFVVKLPSTSAMPEADAFTVIQGGPGGSSIDMAIGLRQALGFIRSKRDVLIVDQRGTGRSNALRCDTPDDEELNAAFDRAKTRQLANKCVVKLSDSDLRFYTTSVAVQDLDAIREAAGYTQLSIYGVSYGTRVAQHYLRRFPEQTRAVILDGVVDVGLSLAGAEVALRSQEAFNSMVARCNITPACFDQFGDISVKFSELRQRLINQPVDLELAHPISGQSINYTINETDLLAAVRFMPYATESTALLPMLISKAHAGNFTALAAQGIQISESINNGLASGMHNSVICTEDAPYIEDDAIAKSIGTVMGRDMLDGIEALCEVWPRGFIDPDFKTPFDSTKPVLILSGESDPITPPINGERAAAMLTNSKHLIVPSQSHGVIGRGCVPFLVRDFIKNASLDDVKPDCIERERAMPFFITTTGPTP